MTWKVKVKKRLGKIEKFDLKKIATSIFKAAQRVGGKDKKLAEKLAKEVEKFLKEKFPKRKIITTDEIGNAVEKVLIERGHAKTSKAYILYRESKRRARKKLIKIKELPKLSEFLKLTERKSVFTSGVFDLIHIGHIRYLKKASLLGDVLIVGVNSDSSTKKLKGKERPILGEELRAEMLSFLEFVDFIVIFPQLTAAKVISMLKPDVYVCAEGSWRGDLEKKPEVREVRKYGGEVVVLPRQSLEVSTTAIIEKIKNEERKFRKNFQIAVAGFLIEDGKLLLVKQRNHNFWTPPGGLVKPGENPEKACAREVKEEVGLDVVCYGILPPVGFYKTENGEEVFIINYLVRKKRKQKINIDTLENQKEEGGVKEWRWVKLDNLKKLPLAPNVLPAVQRLEMGSKICKKYKIKKTKNKKHWQFMEIAIKEAQKSFCLFRKTGAVAVKDGKILISTHNQIMPAETFCKKQGCIREKLGVLPGQKLEICNALHSEMNLIALAAKKNISLNGATLYTTTFPCSLCAKAIANSGIKKVIFLSDYSNLDGLYYLKSRGIEVVRLEKDGEKV
jgi:rfaE bifunctional protein nucleotidyltransferase chain/domain